MKKLVLALAVIASVSMISCTNNNTEATDTIDSTATVEEAACCDKAEATESCADADADAAMLAEAQKAAEEICNCASADKTKIAACMKQILATSYQAYQNNDKFVKAVEQGVGECAMNKAKEKVAEEANKAVDKAAEKAAEELSKKIKF